MFYNDLIKMFQSDGSSKMLMFQSAAKKLKTLNLEI